MKKLLKIILGFVAFLFLLLLLIPVFFKDKIKDLIVAEFEKNTEATLYFDDFGLSLLRNFPDFTLSLDEMGVIGKGVFESDTLFQVDELAATVDLNEVLFGEELNVKSIAADGAQITILVLADGTANYDIVKPSETVEEEDSNSNESVSLGLNSIVITNSEFIFYDQSLAYFMQLNGINISGEGDFANDIFDLKTEGRINDVEVTYEGVDYLHNKSIDLDMILAMDLPNSVYTFKDNIIHVNDFPLAANGSFSLLDDGFGMDLRFSSPGAEFKQLLSLVPAIYTESFDQLETSGSLKFDGTVKGEYNETEMPAFTFNLLVNDGYFHYPDLPDAVKDVQIDLGIQNSNGIVEDTRVDLKQFHMQLGSNPVDAQLIIENLRDYRLQAELAGELNLAELSQYYPMEGYDLRGLVTMKANASGIYDSISGEIPRMDIGLSLENGFIQMPDIPAPIEQLNLVAGMVNETGKLPDTEIRLDDLSLNLEGQKFEANMEMINPESPQWKAVANGSLDLEKLMAIYPMEGMSLKGKIETSLQSEGNMKALEAGRYDQLPTSGQLQLKGFSYQGEGIDLPIEISTAQADFDNNSLILSQYQGKAGSTSYEMKGRLDNFIGFALNDELLTGNLEVQADQLLVDEWMTSTEEEVSSEGDAPLEVVRIPENVSFDMSARVGRVQYNKLQLNQLEGDVEIKDGAVRLKESGFKALNGSVLASGEYDSKPEKPTFDFNLGAQEISIPASFQSVDMVQKFAPVTEKMTGLFSTDFNIKGALGSDMMPDYSSLTGGGLIQVLQASLGQSNILNGLSSVTKLNNLGQTTLERIRMSAEIKEGKLFIKPFDVNLGEYTTTVSGSTGIDGSIDYLLKMNVPAGKVGSQLNSLVGSLTGASDLLKSNNLILNVGMSGQFTEPKFNLRSVASANGETVQNTVTATVESKVEEKKEELKAEINTKVDSAKDSANQLLKAKSDTLKTKADSLLRAKKDSLASKTADKLGVDKDSVEKTLEKAKEKAKGVLEGILKRKKKNKKEEEEGGGGGS